MNAPKLASRSHPVLDALIRSGFAVLLNHALLTVSHASGTVVAWGDNSFEQSTVPPTLADVVAIAGGGLHCLALKSDGTVAGWGDSGFGETNAPMDLTNGVAIAAGFSRSLALRSDGSVVGWGILSAPTGLTNVAAIAAGWGDQSLALLRDGTVVAWGDESPVPAGLTNLAAIAVGSRHRLALKPNGTVVAWGDDSSGNTNVPAGLTNVVAIAAGEDHSLALKGDGRVVAWGNPDSGRCNVPAGLTNVVAIAAGARHSLALKGDGTMAAWGDNSSGQSRILTGLGNVVAIAGGGDHTLALVGDGSPVITVQPRSQSVATTKDAVLQVMAVGAQPLKYQWQRNGTPLPGATTAILTLRNLRMSDLGYYSVVVTNSQGSVTSASALLTPVETAPSVTVPPADQGTFCGDGATFRVTADGSKPFSYQWLFESAPVGGATNATLNLKNVTPAQAGRYAVAVTNTSGSITSAPATLTVVVEPPLITSALTNTGKQGSPFTYTILARHNPLAFNAWGLPAGLGLNTTNGVIAGTPLENGTFNPVIQAVNACTDDLKTLTLILTSSVPVITSVLTTNGTEEVDFTYSITATESPTGFGAQGLPLGLSVDPTNGVIAGRSVYAGAFDTMIWASNVWGVGTAMLHLTFSNAPVAGLAIANVTYNYSSPYLLDFQFSLRDDSDPAAGHAVVVPPRLLSVTCKEDDVKISPTETAFIVERGSAKQVKCYLVLDFTESIASLLNGDANGDGISDAVDSMVGAAKDFVNQQPGDAQIGVFEFHREDVDPQKVAPLTIDKTLLAQSIDGIWTNYVQWFPAGSRCWDALSAAIAGLGASNRDEQRYVIFVSDGRDESSTNVLADVIGAAVTNDVKVYCVGFGNELDTTTLTDITSQTAGRYYTATNAADLAAEFAQIGKDLSGQYILRWATLKRTTKAFMPSFEITYQGFTALSPVNPVWVDTNNPVIDTNSTPPTTNFPFATNFIIASYAPKPTHTGDVTVGALRLLADAEERPSGILLRAAYTPRYIRRLRLHYRANYPYTLDLRSTAPGEILSGWSLTETNDGAGGTWLELTSPNPQSFTNSLPYGAMGNLLKFSFREMTNARTAFSLMEVDNTIYQTTGRQSFVFETNAFLTAYPVLPYGTPSPWLLAHGFTTNFPAAEVSDPDGDGLLTWQEYQANTDPRDPASKFVVRRVAPTGPYGRYQVTFSTALHRKYRVESSPDLVTWETVQDAIDGLNADVTVTDPRNPFGITRLYYRVLVY